MPLNGSAPDRFHRIGSHLATDFVNTVYDPADPAGSLRSPRDIIAFLIATASIDPPAAAELRRTLADAAVAERWFQSALTLRGAIAEALTAFEARRPLPPKLLAQINGVLRKAAGYESLVARSSTAYDLQFVFVGADPAAALAPVARAAAELLANPRSPVRKCADPECVRHFVDDSRTGRRRWCEMAVCGNRAKVNAFLERKRSASAERSPSERRKGSRKK